MKDDKESTDRNREVTEILVMLNPYDLASIWIWGKEEIL